MSNYQERHYAFPLFIIALMTFFTSFIIASFVESSSIEEQLAEQTRTKEISAEQIANIDTIELKSPDRVVLSLSYDIKEQDNIVLTQTYHNEEESNVFDVNQSDIHIDGKVLTIELHENKDTDLDYATLNVALPMRDWEIKKTDWNTFDPEVSINNHGNQPINLTVVAHMPTIRGKYKQLDIWQLKDVSLVHMNFDEFQISVDKLNIWSEGVRFSFEVDGDEDTFINEVNIHSTGNSAFDTDKMNLLDRLTWQEISETDKAKLQAYRDEDNLGEGNLEEASLEVEQAKE